jgi:uncharacterized membrane protein YsdA (DUF1294 family)
VDIAVMWMIIPAAYAIMSAITFIAFWRDKRAAARSGWRTPEASLHLLELLGGWPGALLAQRLFRHKSSKMTYRLALWAIVILHAGAWIAWLWWRSRQT